MRPKVAWHRGGVRQLRSSGRTRPNPVRNRPKSPPRRSVSSNPPSSASKGQGRPRFAPSAKFGVASTKTQRPGISQCWAVSNEVGGRCCTDIGDACPEFGRNRPRSGRSARPACPDIRPNSVELRPSPNSGVVIRFGLHAARDKWKWLVCTWGSNPERGTTSTT